MEKFCSLTNYIDKLISKSKYLVSTPSLANLSLGSRPPFLKSRCSSIGRRLRCPSRSLFSRSRLSLLEYLGTIMVITDSNRLIKIIVTIYYDTDEENNKSNDIVTTMIKMNIYGKMIVMKYNNGNNNNDKNEVNIQENIPMNEPPSSTQGFSKEPSYISKSQI